MFTSSRFLKGMKHGAGSRSVRARIGSILMVLVLVFSLVGVSYTGASAAPTTYYVNNTVACADNASHGTQLAPFCTITYGAGAAVAGDTVRVVAGTYGETVVPPRHGTSGSPITFSAAPGVIVTGDGTSTGSVFRFTSSRNYINIDGFTVNDTTAEGILRLGHLHLDHEQRDLPFLRSGDLCWELRRCHRVKQPRLVLRRCHG